MTDPHKTNFPVTMVWLLTAGMVLLALVGCEGATETTQAPATVIRASDDAQDEATTPEPVATSVQGTPPPAAPATPNAGYPAPEQDAATPTPPAYPAP
jgi:hypothetical protein